MGVLSQQSSFTTVDVAARAWCQPGLVSNELGDDRDTYRAYNFVHTTKYSMAATHLLSYLVRVMGHIRLNLIPVK